MANLKNASKVKLIIGLMYSDEQICKQTIEKLKQQYGEFQQGPTINFDFTEYYQEETGKDLKKMYLAFTNLINREHLPEIKLSTNKIEQLLSINGKRRINIDPGYMTQHQVVLASVKEHPNRIFLSNNIYGQIVLVFCRNEWTAVEKTFADYQQKEVKEFLLTVRKNLAVTKSI